MEEIIDTVLSGRDCLVVMPTGGGPRVGKNNGSTDDLPVRLDKEGIPQYDESQLIRQEDQEGNETGIFRAYSTIREIVIDGQVKKVPVGYAYIS